ncbi:hypothetical protein B0H16DRAFT_368865 [Mycena metata]|uniref:Uncharacterized protein n=1 Tax=Mycena metata TaxID=1033252 RepID=A0AAD7JK88_9AGAR|nr:hypothetical protein B0H16DRAFT_368865 [Mycena metata]
MNSLPLSFLVSIMDSTPKTATSRAENITAGTISLDSSGLCTAFSADPTDPNSGSTDTTVALSSSSTSLSATPQSSSTSSATSGKTSPTGTATSSPTSPASASAPTSTADAASASGTAATHKNISSGAIAGGVVGGVVLLALLGTAFQYLRKRHRKMLLDDITETNHHLALHVALPRGSRRSRSQPFMNIRPPLHRRLRDPTGILLRPYNHTRRRNIWRPISRTTTTCRKAPPTPDPRLLI